MMQSSQCHLDRSTEGNFIWSTPYSAVFGFLIPMLVGIVDVSVQGTTKPLLATHAPNIWSSLLATVIYYSAVAAADVKPRQHSSPFLGLISIVSGFLSSVSLVTILVPPSISYIILSLAWIFATMIFLVHQFGKLFMEQSRRLYDKVLGPFFLNIWNRFQGDNNVAEHQRPPV